MNKYLAQLKSEKQAPRELQKVQKEDIAVFTVPKGREFISGMLADAIDKIDQQGRPWPSDSFESMPQADMDRLREIERSIDLAALAGDVEALEGDLESWSTFLLSRRH